MKLPQLHLRDLFWLIALVAMGCGWLREYWLRTKADDQTARTLVQKKVELKELRQYYRESAAP